MSRKGWYMVCYDIGCPRRLGKVHRLMKKNGIAAQRSVFFIRADEHSAIKLMDKLGMLIKDSEDDIRAYPVDNPKKVWTTGGVLEAFPLIMVQNTLSQSKTGSIKKTKKMPLWKRLLTF